MDGRLSDPKTDPAALRLQRDRAEQWLYPMRSGYRAWQGLLPELMEAADDDELLITVEGPKGFMDELREAFRALEDAAEALGYCRDGYTLSWKQAREPAACKAFLRRVFRDAGTFLELAGQEDAALLGACEKAYETAGDYAGICKASEILIRLLEHQALERPACREVFDAWIDEIRTELWGEL